MSIPVRKPIDKKESRLVEARKKKKNTLDKTTKQRIEKRRLSNIAIKQDIIKEYGKRWMSKYASVMPSLDVDVKEIKNRINTLSNKDKNKSGVPFKSAVDKIKKNSVRSWKFNRERKLNNKLNNINNNLAKELNNILEGNNSPNSNLSPKKRRYPAGTKVEEI